MKTKFTKGSWEPVIYSGEHKVEVWAGDDQIYANGSVTDKEEEFANAHLIASAPDMYNKLKEMSELLTMLDPHTHASIELDCAACDIESLLSKARGE